MPHQPSIRQPEGWDLGRDTTIAGSTSIGLVATAGAVSQGPVSEKETIVERRKKKEKEEERERERRKEEEVRKKDEERRKRKR